MSNLDQFAGSELTVAELDVVSGGAINFAAFFARVGATGTVTNTSNNTINNRQIGLVNLGGGSITVGQSGHIIG